MKFSINFRSLNCFKLSQVEFFAPLLKIAAAFVAAGDGFNACLRF